MDAIEIARQRLAEKDAQQMPIAPGTQEAAPTSTPATPVPAPTGAPASTPTDSMDQGLDALYAQDYMYQRYRKELGLTPLNAISKVEEEKKAGVASDKPLEFATGPVEIATAVYGGSSAFGLGTKMFSKQFPSWMAQFAKSFITPSRAKMISTLTGTATNTFIASYTDEIAKDHPWAAFGADIVLSAVSGATLERAINKTLFNAARVADVEGDKVASTLKQSFKTIYGNLKAGKFEDPNVREALKYAITDIESSIRTGKVKLTDKNIEALNFLKTQVLRTDVVQSMAKFTGISPTDVEKLLPSAQGQPSIIGDGTPKSTGSIAIKNVPEPAFISPAKVKEVYNSNPAEATKYVEESLRTLYKQSVAATIGAQPIVGLTPQQNLKTGETFIPKMVEDDYLKAAEYFGHVVDNTVSRTDQLDNAAKFLTEKLGTGYSKHARAVVHYMGTLEGLVKKYDGTPDSGFYKRLYEKAKVMLVEGGKQRTQAQKTNTDTGTKVITKLDQAVEKINGSFPDNFKIKTAEGRISNVKATGGNTDRVIGEYVDDVLGQKVTAYLNNKDSIKAETIEWSKTAKELIPKLAAELKAADGKFTEKHVDKWLNQFNGTPVTMPAGKEVVPAVSKAEPKQTADLPYRQADPDMPEDFMMVSIRQDPNVRPLARTDTESRVLSDGSKVDLIDNTTTRDRQGAIGKTYASATDPSDFTDDRWIPLERQHFVVEPKALPDAVPQLFDPAIKSMADATNTYTTVLEKNKKNLSSFFNFYVNWVQKEGRKKKVPQLTNHSLMRLAEIMGHQDTTDLTWTARKTEAIEIIKNRLGLSNPDSDLKWLTKNEQDLAIILLKTLDDFVYEAKRLQLTPYKAAANDLVLSVRGEIEGKDYVGNRYHAEKARREMGQYEPTDEWDSNANINREEGYGGPQGIVGRPKEDEPQFGEEGASSDKRDPYYKVADELDEGVGGFQDAEASDVASSIERELDVVELVRLGKSLENDLPRLEGNWRQPLIYDNEAGTRVINQLKINSIDEVDTALRTWTLREKSAYRSNADRDLVSKRMELTPSTSFKINILNQYSDMLESSIENTVKIANRIAEDGTVVDALALRKQLMISDIIANTIEGKATDGYAQELANLSFGEVTSDLELHGKVLETIQREYQALFQEFGDGAMDIDRNMAHVIKAIGNEPKVIRRLTKGFLEIQNNPTYRKVKQELTDVSEPTYKDIAEQLRHACS